MRVFIGSSTEQLAKANKIARWLDNLGVEVDVWNEIGVFVPGEYTLDDLKRASENVDAAVFIFAADDLTWYRHDLVSSVRDNVLFEYGFFCGKLSRKNVAFITIGYPKLASDLSGVTLISLDKGERLAQGILEDWIRRINPDASSPQKTDIKRSHLVFFAENSAEDQIYKATELTDDWIEVTIDYSNFKAAPPKYSGVVVSKSRANLSSIESITFELSFLNGLSKLDLEIKNRKENLAEKIEINPQMIKEDKCRIDITSLDEELSKNVDEIVLCTRPSHFTDMNNPVGAFKIRTISFNKKS